MGNFRCQSLRVDSKLGSTYKICAYLHSAPNTVATAPGKITLSGIDSSNISALKRNSYFRAISFTGINPTYNKLMADSQIRVSLDSNLSGYLYDIFALGPYPSSSDSDINDLPPRDKACSSGSKLARDYNFSSSGQKILDLKGFRQVVILSV